MMSEVHPLSEAIGQTDPLNAALAAVLDRLQAVHNTPDQPSPLPERAVRLDLARQVQTVVNAIVDDCNDRIATLMESDYESIPDLGWLVRTPKPDSTAGSNWSGIREDGKRAIVRKVAVDHATGEIRPDWRHVAEATLDLTDRCLGLGAGKVGFRSILHLDPDDYMVYTSRGFEVRIESKLA